MSESCRALIADRIRSHGPLTFAEFMDLALYAPGVGYYARAAQRSGRTGDFFTSVDVGPLFGELLAVQFAEMGRILVGSAFRRIVQGPAEAGPHGSRDPETPWRTSSPPADALDLVEAGAGNARLTRDLLDAWQQQDPAGYETIRVHLVERSGAARDSHVNALGPHAPRLVSSTDEFPDGIHGIIYANELLDALPTHVVSMTDRGLREVVVDLEGNRFVEHEAAPSTGDLESYLARVGVTLMPGWRAEVNLAAVAWVTRAVNRLTRGFLVIVDYGHEASELYNVGHSRGTLATFQLHRNEIDARGSRPSPWLADPGSCDITAHVDLTSVRMAAESAGATMLGMLDQTYFVMALGLERGLFEEPPSTSLDRNETTFSDSENVTRHRALKMLMQPGGLGSTHKVLLFGKNVGTPRLVGCSYRMRVT